MKLNKLALALTASALLPALAHAATDEVAASFERDLQRSITIESVVVARKGIADPLAGAISGALSRADDTVWASFERDRYRAPTLGGAVLTAEAGIDPLVTAIQIALWGEAGKPEVEVDVATNGLRHES